MNTQLEWSDPNDQHAMEMNDKVRNLNEVIRQIQQRSVLPVRLLVVADLMERSFPEDASSNRIHFDRPKGVEWLNSVFQRHISTLEADLLVTAQFTFGPPRHPLSLPQDPCPVAWERESTQETARGAAGPDYRVPCRGKPRKQSHPRPNFQWYPQWWWWRPAETSRTRYLEKMKELDMEDLECRQELAEALGLKHVSHEDLSVDWLKAHEAHFSRARMMETEDLTGIPLKSIMGSIKYRPLKLLGSPGLIVESPKQNEYRKNQIGNSDAIKSGRQATGAELYGTPRRHLRRFKISRRPKVRKTQWECPVGQDTGSV